MPINFGTRRTLFGGAKSYMDKVLGTQPGNLILYHPMNEPSGSVAKDYSAEGNVGAYTGVTLGQPGIGDGNTCPFFDGANDFNHMYSAGLNADFNGKEGTIACWAKVNAAGIWTDSTARFGIGLYIDGNNFVYISRRTTNNNLQFLYQAGAVYSIENDSGHSETDWMHLALTFSKSAGTTGEVKSYFNGSQVGLTKINLGTWAGNLNANQTNVGCSDNSGPTSVWHGWLAHCVAQLTPHRE